MKKLLLLSLGFVLWNACTYKKGEVPVAEIPCDSMSYSTHIDPIIATYCIDCHTAGGTGTGDFTSYSDLKIAADNGSLKRTVFTLKSMPPAGSPELTDEQRANIKCWVEQGAPQN